ncbi:GH92 family glycosyl hydrolase [Streptomyces sp. NPDC127068]|uniref:GH92 family glycosyl hydrolase n=1 Tax=Streptomyces sp. NPDC127068 TaxID=3347127 RepID=UPI00365EC628
MRRRIRHGTHRTAVAVCTALLLLGAAGPGTADTPPDTAFTSSFETGHPAPDRPDPDGPDPSGQPPASGATLESSVDRGPARSPTAKTHAGFTGTGALHYRGAHRTDGRAHARHEVFDVDVRVGPDTELGYRIFPEMTDGDLDYRATRVSVDLAFTDGTLLSRLGARDQHGFPLSPHGQGAAKVLYVNQWNDVVSRIGAVARGRTVDRVLLAYDAPKGPGQLGGWVDDLVLRTAGDPAADPRARPSDLVSTVRGTHSSRAYSRGNTFPATAVPHGFNFWTPITDAGSLTWLYDYARGNGADNLPTLQAFGASHEPSPWIGDRQTFQIMPSTASGTPDAGRRARALAFRHENETARPHSYGVTFENGLRAEMAPTDHAAALRFTFPGEDANLLFDNVSDRAGLTLRPDSREVTGYSDVRSGLSAGATRLFVYGVLDRPVRRAGPLTSDAGGEVAGYVRLDAGPERTVTLRLATSLISLEQAKANLRQEIPEGTPFEAVRAAAQRQWDALLGRVRVKGASPEQLTTLYSNLYRLYLYPNSGFETVDGSPRYASPFSPQPRPDTPVRTGARIVPGRVYVNNGFWDTYRTTWPAYAFLTPEHAGRLVEGFVQQYRDGGWTSRWSSPGYADLMTGTSSDVAFADAYLKGVRFDAERAYEAALKNATVVPSSSGVGRKGMATSPFLGYTSTTTREGLSWAVEGFVNDHGIGRMARALYERTGQRRYREEATYFLDRARHYVNLFDARVGFFQGRDAKGRWRLDPSAYDPRVWGHDYTETNGWGYAFSVPHDTRGLANLYGGRAALAARLDRYFATPETARFPGSYGRVIHEMTEARDVRMGQYGHANQVAHHVAYLYDAAGQPWKAQAKVREVLARLYTGSTIGQGYHGDEDNGEQSAWYLFSALGFYPLVLGGGEYAVGSPLFTEATVRMDNGRTLVVRAPRNSARNVYVQGLTVNGKPWRSTALPHEVLARGGVVEFAMGPRPSSWGTGPGAAPASLTGDDRRPVPRADLLRGAGPLFDDTSATSERVRSVALPVGRRGRAVQYTLTSAERGGARVGWVLQGSAGGAGWRTLDRRVREGFAWGRQLRVFSVPSGGSPVAYERYRLVFDREVALAEVELLG